jgi:hypothetical protein
MKHDRIPPNPKGRGHLSTFLGPSSFADARYASLFIPRTAKKWLPSLTTCICRYTLVTDSKDNIFADTNQNQLFEDALLWLGARRD